MTGVFMRKPGEMIAAGVAAATLVAGAASCIAPERTYGEGSVLFPEGGCNKTTTEVVLDANGDYLHYAVDDMSVDSDRLRGGTDIGGGERAARAAVNDQLRVEAVGRAGTSEVTEVVFQGSEGQDLVIEAVEGLPWDQTVPADEEYRVSVEDLRKGLLDKESDSEGALTFAVREYDREAGITVQALEDPQAGAAVTFTQDCSRHAKVAD